MAVPDSDTSTQPPSALLRGGAREKRTKRLERSTHAPRACSTRQLRSRSRAAALTYQPSASAIRKSVKEDHGTEWTAFYKRRNTGRWKYVPVSSSPPSSPSASPSSTHGDNEPSMTLAEWVAYVDAQRAVEKSRQEPQRQRKAVSSVSRVTRQGASRRPPTRLTEIAVCKTPDDECLRTIHLNQNASIEARMRIDTAHQKSERRWRQGSGVERVGQVQRDLISSTEDVEDTENRAPASEYPGKEEDTAGRP